MLMTKLIDAAIFTIDSLVAVLRMLCQRKIKKKYTTEREAMNKKKKRLRQMFRLRCNAPIK